MTFEKVMQTLVQAEKEGIPIGRGYNSIGHIMDKMLNRCQVFRSMGRGRFLTKSANIANLKSDELIRN